MTLKIKAKKIHLPEIVGKGYGTFWNYKGRYRVIKGSRASKKSTTCAMNLIYRIMEYPKSNALVVRKIYRTLKDSCFSQLKWAIYRLGVENEWEWTISPLELTYLPTGQKILFRGLDEPMKLASINVPRGFLTFVWIEEAYEISRESDFDMLDESIRGKVPEGLFKQITLSFNPWNEKHWLKGRFFDNESDNILSMTTNYKCNEWLDDDDRKLFEDMKVRNPKRYEVAGLGNWGIVEGLIYTNWKEETFDIEKIRKKEEVTSVFGLDYGYTNDPTALFCGLVDEGRRKLYVFDEIYKKGLSNEEIAELIFIRGYAMERIYAENAEPKSNARLRTLGIKRLITAKKSSGSVNQEIDYLQGYEIIVHPRCVNFITEISNYQWGEDKFENKINTPADGSDDHLMDAMRYAMQRVSRKIQANLKKEGLL